MPTPLPEMADEIDTVYKTLSDYANDVGSYLYNPGANPLPEFDETQLVVDQLLGVIQNNADGAVDLTSGAMSSTVYKVAGVLREVGTRRMTKAMLYDAAVGVSTQETEELRGDGGKRVAELKSTTPAQAEGT